MYLKMEFHLKWNITQIRLLLKLECHLTRNITHTGMSLKLKYNLNFNVTQIGGQKYLPEHQHLPLVENQQDQQMVSFIGSSQPCRKKSRIRETKNLSIDADSSSQKLGS